MVRTLFWDNTRLAIDVMMSYLLIGSLIPDIQYVARGITILTNSKSARTHHAVCNTLSYLLIDLLVSDIQLCYKRI
jgi:hypothetical protein